MKIQSINMLNAKQNPAFGAYKVPRPPEGDAIMLKIGEYFPAASVTTKCRGSEIIGRIIYTHGDIEQLSRCLKEDFRVIFARYMDKEARMLRLPDVIGKTKDEIGRLVTCTVEDFIGDNVKGFSK